MTPTSTNAPAATLGGRDFALLIAFTVVLFSFMILYDRPLGNHETVHCVNIREMRLDGDWIIPHMGGRPWLERPPLPFWLTMPLVSVLGDTSRAYRLAPLLVALPVILMAGWIASLWFGRRVGLLAGMILATCREFTHYAVAPECDMFLCGVITTAMWLFVHVERNSFRSGDGPKNGMNSVLRDFLWGRRSWALVGFFFVLGLANLVKGLFFGDLLILVPVAAYLLLGGERWPAIRRYVWLPGWVVFAVTGSAWAIAAYLRYPDVVELWKSDYIGRLNQGYMGEGVWYYPVHLLWVMFPWTVPALLGLWMTRGQAFGHGRTPERFLWIWAIAPVIFLSIPQGKHHHYLLHAMAPWAILGGLGTVRLLEVLPTLGWLRTPWPTLLALGVPGEIALAVLVPRYPVPDGLLAASLVLWPACLVACWWTLTRKEQLRACVALFALLIVCHWAGYLHPVYIERRYSDDLAFLDKVRQRIPADAPLLLLDAKGPLDPSWLLYYTNGRGTMLHNITFLRDEHFAFREAYLIARPWQIKQLPEYGQGKELFHSAHSSGECGPEDRMTLYRVRFHDHLARHHGSVYISPMQATGRTAGPELTREGKP